MKRPVVITLLAAACASAPERTSERAAGIAPSASADPARPRDTATSAAAPTPAGRPPEGDPAAPGVQRAAGPDRAEGRPSPEVGRVGDLGPLFYLRAANPERAGIALVDLNRWVGEKATEPRRVLLAFAAEYCAPCKKELAAYALHHRALREAGAEVVVVLVDEDAEGRRKMQALLRDEIALPFPVVADTLQIIAKGYGVSSLPHNVILGPDGRIAWVKKGYAEGLSIPVLLEALRAR